MYTNQKLRVRWNAEFSDSFATTNGVKQGGVISPVLFCVYMDGLLAELADSSYGCFMSGVFAGAFAYADDITLLAPSVRALHGMAALCEHYAKRFDVQFNAKKSGCKVKCVDTVVHLGHIHVP